MVRADHAQGIFGAAFLVSGVGFISLPAGIAVLGAVLLCDYFIERLVSKP